MRIFLLLTCSIALLFAISAEDLYRVYKTKGIGAVEELLKREFEPKVVPTPKIVVEKVSKPKVTKVKNPTEKQLLSRDFWLKQIAGMDVSYGYYEAVDSVIVCEKERKRCNIYKNSFDEGLEFVGEHDVIMGKSGDKIKRGDLKTPVGVYDVTRRFKPGDTFYGPLAFSLSYPNLYDALRGKSGDGIWIHGKPLDGKDREDLSKGCVVMDNENILKLDTQINAKNTITIIGEHSVPKLSKETVATLLREFYEWREAWRVNDIKTYLSFYANDFKRADGSGKKAFSQTKQSIFARKEKKSIEVERISISPYPMMDGRKVFRINYYQTYKSPSFSSKGEKELYVEFEGNKMAILAEK